MNADRARLATYLRQLADLGVSELFLQDLTARDALDLLSGRGGRPDLRHGAAPASAAAAGYNAVALPASAAAASPDMSAAAASPDRPAAAATAGGPSVRPAAGADRLRVLGDHAAACTNCGLHETRGSVVFGEGSASADVVVVGEAPGQEEDRTGRPFVGRAGRLLDLLLLTAGLPRADVYICNTLKCRPPGNRNPQADEMAACAGFLQGQLEAIAPRVLLAVGKFAAQALLQTDESIGRLRGKVHTYRDRPLVVTYHPAYLLRSPQMTRVAWQDFQLLRRVLDEQA
jgi:uracil-DNA glycosylase